MRILCIGEPLIEFNQVDPSKPEQIMLGLGGDTSNCAIAAARLGAEVECFTRLSADPLSSLIRRRWSDENVAHHRCVEDESAPTGAYVITHDAAGHHFTYLRHGSAASRLGPVDLPADLLDGVDMLHVSAISQAISETACDAVFAAIEQAKAAGSLVSYDTNLRLGLWPLPRARGVIQATIALADIVLPGLDDAQQLTGATEPDAVCDRLLALGAGVVALTLGKHGCLTATADQRWQVPAFPVEAVDATGAGDCFDGAFLVRYWETRDPEAATQFANAAAALSTQGFGALDSLPDRGLVEAFLNRDAATSAGPDRV